MSYVHLILAGRETRGITNPLGKHWDVSKAWMISSSAVSAQVSVAWAGCPRPSLSCSTALFPCRAFCPWVIGQTWSHFNPNLPLPACSPPGKQTCPELKGCTLQRRSGPVRSGEHPFWAGFVKGAELTSQHKFLLRSLSRHCSKLTTVGSFCLKKIYWKLW